MNNFELLCEVWELDWSSSFLPIDVQPLYYCLLKRLSFPHWIAFASLSKIFSACLCELSVLFHWSKCLFLCQSHTVLSTIRSDQISRSVVSGSATPWITARQASLSITNSGSSLRLTPIESVMPSSHLILCHPLLLLPPIHPSIRVFSNESTLLMRWHNFSMLYFIFSYYKMLTIFPVLHSITL